MYQLRSHNLVQCTRYRIFSSYCNDDNMVWGCAVNESPTEYKQMRRPSIKDGLHVGGN